MADPLLTAMTAKADQALAKCRDDVEAMVATHRKILASGRDATVATGLVVYANLTVYDKAYTALLLAVAISMLAEAPQPEAVV